MVRPCRLSEGDKTIWIETVLRCVSAQPPDSRFAVLYGGRENSITAKTVVETGDGVAIGDESRRQPR